MTVSSETSRAGPYAGDGVSVSFAIPFVFLNPSHLRVVLRSPEGIESDLTHGPDYAVSGAGDAAGGAVSLTTPPPLGSAIVILRAVPSTQEVDYPEGGRFPAQTHERALDKLTMKLQQLEEALSRAPVAAATSDGAFRLADPEPGRAIGWNENGDLVNLRGLGDWRGDWATGTNYNPSDFFRDPDDLDVYVVVTPHIAGAAIADDLAAGRIALTIEVADVAAAAAATVSAIPSGGGAGAALIKASAADHDYAWGNPAGGGSSTMASQAEAEAGLDNAKGMTSLRVRQALEAKNLIASGLDLSAARRTTAYDHGRFPVGLGLQDGSAVYLGGSDTLTKVSRVTIAAGVVTVVEADAGHELPGAGFRQAAGSVLNDGRILATGGGPGSLDASDQALLGDFSTPTAPIWTASTALPAQRLNAAQVTLADGRVVVLGGGYVPSLFAVTADTVFIGSVSGGSIAWAASDPLPEPRMQMTADLLPDGRIIVIGGLQAFSPLPTTFFVGEVSGNAIAWTSHSMPFAVYDHATAPLPSGDIAIIGGSRDPSISGDVSSIYVVRAASLTVEEVALTSGVVRMIAKEPVARFGDGSFFLGSSGDVVTPSYAQNALTLPPGGGPGQILAKQSANDGDTRWQDASGATLTFATQAEAEAGASSDVVMSPLRVAEAIAALGGPESEIVATDPGSYDPGKIYFVAPSS